MKLPPPVQAYMDADGRNDVAAVIASFAPDAVVKDEGRTHAGHPAIESWWHTSKSAYKHSIEPLKAPESGNIVEVIAKITGRFPGSPATLAFVFQLEGDRIAALEITTP